MQWLLATVFILAVVWFVRREITKIRASVDAIIARYQPWEKLGVTPDEVIQFRDGYQRVYKEISGIANKLAIGDEEVADAVRVHGLVAILDQVVRYEAQKNEQAKQSERIVTAGEFVLVDAKGNARARLAMKDGDKPILALLNEDGTNPAYFVLTSSGSTLMLGAPQGREEIMLTAGRGSIAFVSVFGGDGFETFIGKACPLDLDRWPAEATPGAMLELEAELPKWLAHQEEQMDQTKRVSAASVVLSKDGKVLWSAP